MATFRTSQRCQDGEENSKCYEWRCQGRAFKDALFRKPQHAKEHIKNSSNRYFIEKLVNLSQILWSKPFSAWYLHENSPSKDKAFKVHITPCKVIRFPESGKFCLWNPNSTVEFVLVELEILDLGIRNSAQEVRNPANDWNPESKFHWQGIWNSIPGIKNPQRGI